MGRVTSSDVAAAAGVSRSTVSYVLNDRPGRSIPESTRSRVREAAERLGYVPDPGARALRGMPAPVILLLLNAQSYGNNAGRLTNTFTALAEEAGHTLVTMQTADPAAALTRMTAHLRPRLVVALVALADADRELLGRLGIPVVDGARLLPDGFEGGAAGRLQAERLVVAGRSRIGYLGSADPWLAHFDAARRAGVSDAVRGAGLPPVVSAALPRAAVDGRTDELRDLLLRWCSADVGVDGLACYNDYWAAGVLDVAGSEGIRVPEDVSVIGMDDEPMGAFLRPRLTTVSLDPAGSARLLFEHGMRLVDGVEAGGSAGADAAEDAGRLAAFAPSVVERASV